MFSATTLGCRNGFSRHCTLTATSCGFINKDEEEDVKDEEEKGGGKEEDNNEKEEMDDNKKEEVAGKADSRGERSRSTVRLNEKNETLCSKF